MKTKLNMLLIALTLAVAAPASADGIDDQIRAQGRAAAAVIGAEVRAPSAPEMPAPATGTETPQTAETAPDTEVAPVDDAIRQQGRNAVRTLRMQIALAAPGGTPMIAHVD